MENQANDLGKTNMVKVPLEECTINISGYSLDNYKTVNPEGYTILCNLEEASGGLSYYPLK